MVADAEPAARAFDLVILGNEQIKRPLIGPAPEYVAKPQSGSANFLVRGQQVGIRIEEPVFVTPATSVAWFWRKDKGHVCIVQFELINPATNQRRYFGYGAGSLAEAPSGDPTVEVFVADTLPAQGARVERNLFNDMKQVLGWEQARIETVYLSPWDGEPGVFGDMVIRGVSKAGPAGLDYARLSRIGTGHYVPSKLPAYTAKHVERFDTSFEECAPGRNSGANEWSAFGAIGDRDFNCIGPRHVCALPALRPRLPHPRRRQGGHARFARQLPARAGERPAAGHLGRLAARRPALQGVRHDRAGREERQLRPLQAGNPEPDGQSGGEQAGRRARRAAGHAPGRRRGPRPGRRAVPDRRPAFGAGTQAPRLGAVRQAGEGVRARAGAGRHRAGGRQLPRRAWTACRLFIA